MIRHFDAGQKKKIASQAPIFFFFCVSAIFFVAIYSEHVYAFVILRCFSPFFLLCLALSASLVMLLSTVLFVLFCYALFCFALFDDDVAAAWYHFNDTTTTKVSEETVASCSPYILVYRRKRHNPSAMPR